MSVKLTRRQFCAAAGACVIALEVPGCGKPGILRFVRDAGDDDLAGGEDDLASEPDLLEESPDLEGSPDLAHGCGAKGQTSTGMRPSSFALNTATLFNANAFPFFVCRDARGLYALSGVCTHQACTVTFQNATVGYNCPCHSSQFSYNGVVTQGPAFSPLGHFSICLDRNGNVVVDPSQVVPASMRY